MNSDKGTNMQKYAKLYEKNNYLVVGHTKSSNSEEIMQQISGKELPKYIEENRKALKSGKIKLFELSSVSEEALRDLTGNSGGQYLLIRKSSTYLEPPYIKLRGSGLCTLVAGSGLTLFLNARDTYKLKKVGEKSLEKILNESKIVDDNL